MRARRFNTPPPNNDGIESNNFNGIIANITIANTNCEGRCLRASTQILATTMDTRQIESLPAACQPKTRHE